MPAAIRNHGNELGDAERHRYASDGYFVRPSVLGGDQLDDLRDAAECSLALAQQAVRHGRDYRLGGNRFVDVGHTTLQFEHEGNTDALRVIEPVHEFDPRWDDLIDDPRLTMPARGLIGVDRIALWTDKLNAKCAMHGSGFGWHQDSPYWVHDCAHVDLLPNVYVALDDATERNGCLRIVRGSHTRGCLPGRNDGSPLAGFFTHPDCFDERDQIALEVPAGSLVFFSPHAVHGSRANGSDQARRAVVITYQPADQPMLKAKVIRNVR